MIQNKYVNIQSFSPDSITLTYYKNGIRKSKKIKISWYFLISKTDYEKNKAYINFLLSSSSHSSFNCTVLEKVEEVNKYVKLYCTYTRDEAVAKIKSLKIQTYEADLTNQQRFWLDADLHVSDEYKIAFFDIEVDDSSGGLDIGKSRILSYSLIDSDGKEIYYSLKEIPLEKDLLAQFNKDIANYDLMVTWNGGSYDVPYIRERMKMYFMRLNYVPHIDMMQRMIHAHRFNTQIRSFALDYIANMFLGISKVKRTTKVIDMFNNDYGTFKRYNIQDSRILYELEKKASIITMALRQAYWCNIFPKDLGLDGSGMYKLLDSIILRKAHENGEYGPTPKYSWEELRKMSEAELDKLKYPGATVLTPITGVFDNAYNFDFKSLYPSLIRTANISFDTLTTDTTQDVISSPAGTKFIKTKRGIIPQVIDELIGKRKEYKEEKLKLIEAGKKNSTEYGIAEANEAVVKETANCLHPNTLLLVYDSTTKEYLTDSIENIYKLYDSNHSILIQSYNFTTKQIEWKPISYINKLTHSGELVHLKFQHSNDIYCTPNHKLLGFNYNNVITPVRSSKNRIKIINRYNKLDFCDKINTQQVVPISASEYSMSTVTLAKAGSCKSFQTNTEYLDIRSFDMSDIISLKTLKLNIYYNYRKKSRNTVYNLIDSSSSEFNTLIQTLITGKKGKRNPNFKYSKNKYCISVPVSSVVWNCLRQLQYHDILKYEMTLSLGYSHLKCPILIKLTSELLYSLGLWLAEGTCSFKCSPAIIGGFEMGCINRSFIDKSRKGLETLKMKVINVTGTNRTHTHNRYYITGCHSAILGKIIKTLFYKGTPCNSYTKYVPSFVFELDNTKIKSFLNGYFDGDANRTTIHDRVTTTSKFLAYQISELTTRVYNTPSKLFDYSDDKFQPGYKIEHYLGDRKHTFFDRYNNEITYDTIKSISTISYNDYVYDIEVSDNHNFFIGNILSKNSCYGILGLRGSRYFGFNLAESITLFGQWCIHTIKDFAENYEKYVVIMGDSVSKDTVILIKDSTQQIKLLRFDEVWNNYATNIKFINGKEYADVNLDSLSYNYLTQKVECKKITKLIRHKYSQSLEFIQHPFCTPFVTKDHSLMSNGKKIKPSELPKKETYLKSKQLDTAKLPKFILTGDIQQIDLSDYIDEFNKLNKHEKITVTDTSIIVTTRKNKHVFSKVINCDSAFGKILGSYLSEGSITENIGTVRILCGWHEKWHDEVIAACNSVFGKNNVKQYSLKDASTCVKLHTQFIAFVFYKLCNKTSSHKQLPDNFLYYPSAVLREILRFYQLGDGCKKYYKPDLSEGSFGGKSRKLTSQFYYLITSTDLLPEQPEYIRFKSDHAKLSYSVRWQVKQQRPRKTSMMSVSRHEIKYNDYVYDIEVKDNHTFIDILGGCVLHNTDSTTIVATPDFDIQAFLDKFHAYLKNKLKTELNIDTSYLELAFDRYFKRFILLKKKNYAGWLVNQEGRQTDYIHVRGLEIVKSSSCKIAKKAQKQLIEMLLKENNSKDFYIQWLQEQKDAIFNNITADDISLHVKISKKLGEYKNITLPVILAQKKKAKEGVLILKEIEYIITSSSPKLDGIEASEYSGVFDKTYYWNRVIFPCLKRILIVAFPDVTWDDFKIKKIKKPKVEKIKKIKIKT